MRNITKHPITFDEKIETLRQLQKEIDDTGRVGGVESLVIDLIIKDLEATPELRAKTYP